jgi:hypothetical protein
MLAPGLDKCPICGAKLGKKAENQYTGRDIFWLSAYIIGIALIPLLVAIVIGIICVLTNRL